MASAILLLAVSVVAVLGFGLGTGRVRAVPILSGSMRPLIQPGDVAVLTPTSAELVRKGDVIIFQPPTGHEDLVMHRVLRVESDAGLPTVTTKGDANPTKDPWKARIEDDVVWKYSARVPYVGHLALWARAPVVRFGSVLVAVIIVMFVVMRAIWRTAPREVELNASG